MDFLKNLLAYAFLDCSLLFWFKAQCPFESGIPDKYFYPPEHRDSNPMGKGDPRITMMTGYVAGVCSSIGHSNPHSPCSAP